MVPLNIYVAPFLIENYEMGIYEKLGFLFISRFSLFEKNPNEESEMQIY